jgi:hypothetical protein
MSKIISILEYRATREAARPRQTSEEEGEVEVGVMRRDNEVVIDFSQPISQLRMTKEEGAAFLVLLAKCLDITREKLDG